MPDGTWAVHRKLHVLEHANICAGDRCTVFDTLHGCRVGVLICYDTNIVEKRARHHVTRGRDPARAASDGRLQFGEPTRDEAGGSRYLGAA